MRKILFSLAALVSLAATGATDVPVQNPGFENEDGWKVWGIPSNFTSDDRKAVMQYDTTRAAAGERSLKLLDRWTDARPYTIQFIDLNEPLAAGYLLSFKAQGEAGKAFRVGMQFGRRTDGVYESLKSTFLPLAFSTGDWEGFSVIFDTFPAETTVVSITLGPTDLGKEFVGEAWFDEVRLQALSEEELVGASNKPPLGKLGKQTISQRDLCLQTGLVANGQAAAAIVAPAEPRFQELAAELNQAVKARTGIELPVVTDQQYADSSQLDRHLIMLGNRDDNESISNLYMRHYVILDAQYPGTDGGSVVRTLHNPFGDQHNVIFAGGSDSDGTRAAVTRLAALIEAQPKGDSLSFGFLADIRLGSRVQIPETAVGLPLWEQSTGYGNRGVFGWNTLSRNLVLLYLTNEQRYADEFMRLAFPKDAATARWLAEQDDQAYLDSANPLGAPYHYYSIMTMLLWDIVEESPVFSDGQRLQVIRKFYEQLVNRLTIGEYFNIYGFAGLGPMKILPGRHYAWETLTVYVTSRYFNKYYPGFDSAEGLRLVRNAMATLDQYAAVEISSLFYYGTYIQPLFVYAALEGGNQYRNSPVLQTYMEGLAALSDNRPGDWSQKYSSLAFLLLTAALTTDQAPVELMRNTGLDNGEFKAGQSFYPPASYTENFFQRTSGQWYTFRSDPLGMDWKPSFSVDKMAEWMTWRQLPGADGDYLLLDTKYGPGGRVPFHNFNILTFRLGNDTLLHGYFNQLILFADGLTSATSCDYSEILDSGKLGDNAYIEAKLTDYNGFDWRRMLLLCQNRYLLVYDEVIPRRDLLSVEIINSFLPASDTRPQLTAADELKLTPPSNSTQPATTYLISSSLPGSAQQTRVEGGLAVEFLYESTGRAGRPIHFATLLRPGQPADQPAVAAIDDERIAMRLPEEARLCVQDDGFILTRADDCFFGWRVTGVPEVFQADQPVICSYADGNLKIKASKETKITLPDGRQFDIPAGGEKDISCSFASPPELADEVGQILAAAAPDTVPIELNPVWSGKFPGPISELIAFREGQKAYLAATMNNKVLLLDAATGETVREFPVAATVGAIHYLAPAKLLLIGCLDEALLAYTLDGTKKWEFTSVMPEELSSTNETFWFKKALPGVNTIDSVEFEPGRPLIFVGSTSSVEILNADGELLKRTRTECGRVTGFAAVPAIGDRPPAMLAFRQMGGWPRVFAFAPDLSCRDMKMIRGADGKDMGSYGYNSVGRNFIRVSPLEPEGEPMLIGDFNGALNRLGIWNTDGQIQRDVHFGPGFRADCGKYGSASLRNTNVRGLEVVDFNGDGHREIAVAYNRQRLFLFDADLEVKKVVKLPANPTLLRTVERSGAEPLLAIGSFNGEILIADGAGKLLSQNRVNGAVSALSTLGNLVVGATNQGEIIGLDTAALGQ